MTPTLAGRQTLVLGATGFIGRWVARGLAVTGARVTLVARDRPAAERIGAEYGWNGRLIEADVTNRADLETLIRDVRPAVTFNLVGYGVDRSETNEDLAQVINADLVRIVLDLVARWRDETWSGPSLIHTGSALEYGSIGGTLDEDREPNPTTLYGRTKLEGTRAVESAVARGQCRALTARLFTVYGPGEHEGRLMPTVLAARTAAEPVPMTDGTQRRDFTYVGDVMDGLLRAASASTVGPATFNLATGTLHSVRQFVEIAGQALKVPATQFRFGALPQRPDEMAHEAVATKRLRGFLGWVPGTSIGAGAVATAAFLDRTAKPASA